MNQLLPENQALLNDLSSAGRRLQGIPWPEHKELRRLVWDGLMLLRAEMVVAGEEDPWPALPTKPDPVKCHSRRRDGQPCGSWSLWTTLFCSVHASPLQKQQSQLFRAEYLGELWGWYRVIGCPFTEDWPPMSSQPNLKYWVRYVEKNTVSPF